MNFPEEHDKRVVEEEEHDKNVYLFNISLEHCERCKMSSEIFHTGIMVNNKIVMWLFIAAAAAAADDV